MKIIFFFLIFTNLSNCLAANTSNGYPVKWTSAIQLKSLQEIPDLFANKDYVGQTAIYENTEGKRASAKTCNDYFKLTKEHYYPIDNSEIAMQSFFIDKCRPLLFLQSAKTAQQSFIRNFILEKDYGLLPATIIFPPAERSDEQQEKPLKEGYSDVQVEKDKNYPGSLILSSKSAGTTTHISSILAWGDFNHDGIDDMMISVAHYSYHYEGTYHSYKIYIVTRKSKDGPIKQIKLPAE